MSIRNLVWTSAVALSTTLTLASLPVSAQQQQQRPPNILVIMASKPPPLPPIDHSLKFSNPAGRAGIRKLPARNKSAPREHKTFDELNFLCV